MIRYPVSEQELHHLIDQETPNWRQRAQERTEQFRALGKYQESSSIWSEVKVVYMRLQKGKCAYCEREMASEDYGKGEQDVEHYRPKGNVKAWKPSKEMKGLPMTPPPKADKGYYLLPYHPFNYAAACKPCNSALKSDRFPIAGTYRLDRDDARPLADEQPYLIYPLGDLDQDPEQLIEFFGLSPRPKVSAGFDRDRARVVIDFFKLSDAIGRKDLFRARALVVLALYPLLEATATGSVVARKNARTDLQKRLSPTLPHLNCARSFERLYDQDPATAKAIYEKARDLVFSTS